MLHSLPAAAGATILFPGSAGTLASGTERSIHQLNKSLSVQLYPAGLPRWALTSAVVSFPSMRVLDVSAAIREHNGP